jgi:hypothetical protein
MTATANAFAVAPTLPTTIEPTDTNTTTTATTSKPTTTVTPADNKPGAAGDNPKTNPGATRVQGGSDSTLVAQLTLPRPEPAAMVRGWTRALERPNTYAPKLGMPANPAAAVRSSALVVLPLSTGGTTPLGSVFSPGSTMKPWPGEAPTPTNVGDTALAIGNRAMSGERLTRFESLKPEQQEVARAMLKRALDQLQLPAYNADRIAPDKFGEVVDLVLDSARRWQGPQQSTLQRVGEKPLTTISQRPLTTMSERPLTTAASSNASIPAYPSTGPNDPKPVWWDAAADPNLKWTPDPSKPLAGQKEPSWWKDPNMTTWLANLNVTSREFAAQAASINIDRPVDPARSPLTPRQEWQNWKAA